MIKNRKLDHMRICVKENVECGDTGFNNVRLKYRALPEINFDDIKLKTRFLGKTLDCPIIIEAMTGGTANAGKINRDLAYVAQKFNIGFGVGSQRAAIEDPRLEETYRVRDVAPDILLIGNLGAVQLNYGYGLKECRKAVEMIDADALALHMNPLQEVIQPEGDRNFSNLVSKINEISRRLNTPVIAKGVGSGISYETARRLKVDAIDVGGLGGTSWSLVESYRGSDGTKKLGRLLSEIGIPTAESIREVSKLKTRRGFGLIGSGGVRNGLDAGKAFALGADVVGIALPILKAWNKNGKRGVEEYLSQFIMELKTTMFLTGAVSVPEMRGRLLE